MTLVLGGIKEPDASLAIIKEKEMVVFGLLVLNIIAGSVVTLLQLTL